MQLLLCFVCEKLQLYCRSKFVKFRKQWNQSMKNSLENVQYCIGQKEKTRGLVCIDGERAKFALQSPKDIMQATFRKCDSRYLKWAVFSDACKYQLSEQVNEQHCNPKQHQNLWYGTLYCEVKQTNLASHKGYCKELQKNDSFFSFSKLQDNPKSLRYHHRHNAIHIISPKTRMLESRAVNSMHEKR